MQIIGCLHRYRERGFFEIDKKYLNDDFIEDVKKDIVLLKELLDKWFPDGKIKTDPKLDRAGNLEYISNPLYFSSLSAFPKVSGTYKGQNKTNLFSSYIFGKTKKNS